MHLIGLGHFIFSKPSYNMGIVSIPILLMKALKFKNINNLPKTTQPVPGMWTRSSDFDVTHPFVGSTGPLRDIRVLALISLPDFFTEENVWLIFSLSLHIPAVISLTERPGKLWKWCLLFSPSHTLGESSSHSKMSTFRLLQAFSRTQWSVSPSSCCKDFCK